MALGIDGGRTLPRANGSGTKGSCGANGSEDGRRLTLGGERFGKELRVRLPFLVDVAFPCENSLS